MEEKAAEGNVAYFSEYAAEELESKLVKYRDEDGRTLLHTASAAGASSYASLRRVFSDPTRRSPAHPSHRPASNAGKLDLVEFFLATDAGRGLVNVSDEVRVSSRRLSLGARRTRRTPRSRDATRQVPTLLPKTPRERPLTRRVAPPPYTL